jgi:imidazoleglycerol-phosphate dehydratase/histidinol-phosphatase
LLPDVVPALRTLAGAGFRFVMVSNQDGLGTARFPANDFRAPQDFLLTLLASQGIAFDAILICPHRLEDGCACRKPGTALVDAYLIDHSLDRTRSAVIGDRDTDLELARRLGLPGYRLRIDGTPEETWASLSAQLAYPPRCATVARRTRETQIEVRVNLDQDSLSRIATGIGFFDHMLEQIARHAGIGIDIACQGDLRIDEHHTVEDCALALGEALRKALGDKRGIARYGFLLAMDEAQAQVAIDLSGRAYFVFEGAFPRQMVGGLPTELVPHFFRSLSDALGCALHLKVQGENTHHMVESCFKGVGRSLREAVRREGTDIPSTKGTL